MAKTTSPETRRAMWAFEATRAGKKLRSSASIHRLLEQHGGKTRLEVVERARAILEAGLKNPQVIERLRIFDHEKKDFAAAIDRIIKGKSAPAVKDDTIIAMRKSIVAASENWKPKTDTVKLSRLEKWILSFNRNAHTDKEGRRRIARMIERKRHNIPSENGDEVEFREMIGRDPELWEKLQERFDEQTGKKRQRADDAKKKSIAYFGRMGELEKQRKEQGPMTPPSARSYKPGTRNGRFRHRQ